MKICPVCHASVDDNGEFCNNCGAKVAVEPAFQSAPQPNPQYQAPVQPTPQPQYQAPIPPVAPVFAAAPVFNEDMLPEEYKPVSVGKYIGYSLLFGIPLVGIIMLFVTAFGSGTNKSLKNYAKAILLINVIVIVGAILIGVLGGLLTALMFGF